VIAFESFHHEHLPVLRDWLAREHVRRGGPIPTTASATPKTRSPASTC
jgi:hypothetical protein